MAFKSPIPIEYSYIYKSCEIRDRHNSIKPTPLMRYSNLSSGRFNDYYNELVAKGFVKEITDKKGKKYITLTDKGFKFLEKYNLILGFIREFEL